MSKDFEPPTRTVSVGGKPASIIFRKYRLQQRSGESGKGDGQLFVGDRRRVTIGSEPGNDLVLSDPSVSRTHCEITIDQRGYLLRDLDSKNGALLDGVQILAAYMNPGSVIQLGETQLEFRHEEETKEVPLWPEDTYGRLVGPSLEMRALFAMMDRLAQQDITVLVEGESGTGKELIVQEIHAHSQRKEAPLIVFDCSAVPENLVESELFGHVKGAFTGATSDREGAFRLANGGTLFLDEMGELPREIQPKLLRVLENREIRPVGGSTSFSVDVRVIAATNRNLAEEVKKGAFREDLYFRLNVIRVEVPPLRRRKEDLQILITHFLGSAESEGPKLGGDVLAMLMNHSWPGNVRELKNFVDRFRVFAPADAAGAAQLLDKSIAPNQDGEGAEFELDLPYKEAKGNLVSRFEVAYCKMLMEQHSGNVSASARAAGIHRKYLEELVRKHSLK